MRVGIFINTTKAEANKTANIFSAKLADAGLDSKVVNLKEDCKNIDVLAVFGGDGTILRVVEYAIEFDIPIIAINVGTVGFLTSFEASELDQAIKIIKTAKKFTKRAVMKVYIGQNKYYALNEALIEKNATGNSFSGIAKLSLNLNDTFVDKYGADGLILSTPTGSTAYSLSAGGPIISPDMSAFVATPVCAHSLHSRPIVYPDSYTAKVTVLEGSAKCGLYIDGMFIKSLNVNDTVTVMKSKNYIKFYESKENFFEKLLYKLNKWSETE